MDDYGNGIFRYDLAEKASANVTPAWQAFGFDSEETLVEWLKKGEQNETSK